MKQEGAQAGPWRIEPGARITSDGADELAAVLYGKGEIEALIYAKRDELPDLIGALMLYLGVQKIETTD